MNISYDVGFSFWMKCLAILIINTVLIDNNYLGGTADIVLFNLGIVCIWLAWWIEKVNRLYQKNLLSLPSTAKSAKTPESREEDQRYKKMALTDALNGKKTDMRELNW